VEIAVRHPAASDADAPRIIALPERGRGLAAAEAIAAHPPVDAPAFGCADLAADFGATTGWEQMLFARTRIVQAAAAPIVTAFERAQGGACQLDGKMVDMPAVKSARRTVARADRKAA
jgi:citrate lyase beta subunit